MKTFSDTAILACLLLFAFIAAANAQGPKADKSDKNPCPGTSGLTAAEITGLLSAQNAARAELKLAPLAWDCKLADLAQAWATRGVAEHRDDTDFGENIFVASGDDTLPTDAVSRWLREKAFWDNKAAACQAGKVCVHYTQLVWKQTTQVGCGLNRKAPGKWKFMLVCNFNPAGNRGAGAAY